ncbi:MAG TPA: GatB/YqeY domain-containing protein [Solirubrobacterales bacterium]|nr:GatB/YqeY domain-containing protein [Solirubrobacterales bacterium]
MPESTLEKIQADVKTAMKAKDKPRVGALRLIADALQKDLKSGGEDEVAVLRRERKRRLEAAEAYRSGGDSERASSEEAEAEIITGYLPAELSDEELAAIVDDAISETGAAGPQDTGKVMGAAMSKAGGRADGKRVNALVRERLAGG